MFHRKISIINNPKPTMIKIRISVSLSVGPSSTWLNEKIFIYWIPKSYLCRLQDRTRHAILLRNEFFIYHFPSFLQRFRTAIFPKLLSTTTPRIIILGTKSLWQVTVHTTDMVILEAKRRCSSCQLFLLVRTSFLLHLQAVGLKFYKKRIFHKYF